jgi:hypothetical protein
VVRAHLAQVLPVLALLQLLLARLEPARHCWDRRFSETRTRTTAHTAHEELRYVPA